MPLITDAKDEMLSQHILSAWDQNLLRDSLRSALAERDAAIAAKEKAEGALCAMREALQAIDTSEGLSDNWWGNGCEHGFKPAKECHNENCPDKLAQIKFDAALSSTRNITPTWKRTER